MNAKIAETTVDMSTTRRQTPQPNYPSYKSFDRFIDLEFLRSLDQYLAERIRKRLLAGGSDLFLNEHRLDAQAAYVPGVREIWLTRTSPGTPYDYLDLDRGELWQHTPDAEQFPRVMDFVATLPFESTGRILIIFDDSGNTVPAHRDHEQTETCHEFIWFRTNLRKPLYVLNHLTGEKTYIGGYSAWFDTVNQFHGSEAVDGLNFSFRVDGKFTQEFKEQIPYVWPNASSTPAVWTAESGI